MPALLAACSSMSSPDPAPSISKHILEKNFTVGELKSAAVGETMVSLKDYYEKDRQNVWSISEPATLRVGIGSMVLIPGDYSALRRVTKDGTSYNIVEIKVHPFELTTLKPSSATVPMIFFVDDTGRIARAGGGLGITTEVSDLQPADFHATRGGKTSIDSAKGYANFELIYTGLQGGVLRVTYREYSADDLARTAFFQDLTYNLADKTIRFKKLLIDVASADNQSIRFRVQSAPPEWMSAGQP